MFTSWCGTGASPMTVAHFLSNPMLPAVLNLLFGTVVYLFGLYGYTRMKQAKDLPAEKDTDLDEIKFAGRSWRVGRTQKRTIVIVGMTTFYCCFFLNAMSRYPDSALAHVFTAAHWSVFDLYWVVAIGLTFMYVKGVYNNTGNKRVARERSRAGYLDALKTIITAAAAAASIVTAATSRGSLDPDQIPVRDAAILFLVLSILLATCDLFWLNMLYDRSRLKDGEVSNKGIFAPLFLVLWPAGVFFVMGFAYLAALTFKF